MTADPTSRPDSGALEGVARGRPAPDPARAAASAGLPDRIAFLGFGLIGGSIASALRAGGAASELVAWTPAGRGPAEGLVTGLLDRVAPTAAEALAGAGLVILAGPPLAVLATLDDLGGSLRAAIASGATITDVASTKTSIVARANSLGLPFVGGHPMAGVEASGVGAARLDLFVGRPWVVIPGRSAGTTDLARVVALAASVGAYPMRLTAAGHDDAVAAISHMPLVLAAALVEAVASRRGLDGPADAEAAVRWARARQLAAGGWTSMTRLARGDPEMGAGILATNAEPIVARLSDLRAAIDAWIEALDGPVPDAPALAARLAAARELLDSDGPS